jgi:hypothetical protein
MVHDSFILRKSFGFNAPIAADGAVRRFGAPFSGEVALATTTFAANSP